MTRNTDAPSLRELLESVMFLTHREANIILAPHSLYSRPSETEGHVTEICLLSGHPIAVITPEYFDTLIIAPDGPTDHVIDDIGISANVESTIPDLEEATLAMIETYRNYPTRAKAPKDEEAEEDEIQEKIFRRKPKSATVDSKSDARTVNSTDADGNVMRHAYRVLTEQEKQDMQTIKDKGLDFHQYLSTLPPSREISIAKTKLEEVVMWATKSLTK